MDKIASVETTTRVQEYVNHYLTETSDIANAVDRSDIVAVHEQLQALKQRKGRLFILGIGGSSANASHAVNDFRKIAGIEAYAPGDNVAELTAWANDKGWEWIFEEYLRESNLTAADAILVLSVGGGSPSTSFNLVRAMEFAKMQGSTILAIVSRDGGAARRLADASVLVPVVNSDRITPHAEGWQAIIWHLLVNALVI